MGLLLSIVIKIGEEIHCMKNRTKPDMDISPKAMLALNMLCSILSFAVTLGISFCVSPYIVKHLGAEANGFTTLANDFISYATILKVAMNSMGSRFITISYIRGEKDKACKYYSALFFGDLFLCTILSVASIYMVVHLENIVNISPGLVNDVKILFALLFFNFIFNTVTSVWLTATFITNKVYLDKIREVQGSLLRVAVVWILFVFLKPRIYFVAIGIVIASFLQNGFSLYYKVHLAPDLKASYQQFSFKYIKEILFSGIWNAFAQMGSLFFSGMDLIISNLWISPLEMGVLAISKTVPNALSGLNSAIQSVFTPALVGDYARGGNAAIAHSVKSNAKTIMIISTIPLCFLMVYGESFYDLWQPTQDAARLQILSVLACAATAITSCAMSVYNVFTVVNKVKQLSIATLITGVVSFIVTFLLVRNTELGIMAVAGVSSVMFVLRSLLWGLPMAAKYLKLKWTEFYPLVGYNILIVFFMNIIGIVLRIFIPHETWIQLILSGILFACIGLVVNVFVVLNKNEKMAVYNALEKRMKRRK